MAGRQGHCRLGCRGRPAQRSSAVRVSARPRARARSPTALRAGAGPEARRGRGVPFRWLLPLAIVQARVAQPGKAGKPLLSRPSLKPIGP